MQKTVTIKRNNEFLRAYKRGKFFVGKFIILYVLKNNVGMNRLGVSVSKKVGKSVKRNRLKRLVKESYRFYESFIKDGIDMVFVLRNNEIMAEYTDIKKEMKFLLKKLNVFNQELWNCLKDSL